jgi:hypothetical protein
VSRSASRAWGRSTGRCSPSTLEPGTYEVYSPTGDDREDGFEATLEVTEAPASEFPDEQPGIGPSDEMDDMDDQAP